MCKAKRMTCCATWRWQADNIILIFRRTKRSSQVFWIRGKVDPLPWRKHLSRRFLSSKTYLLSRLRETKMYYISKKKIALAVRHLNMLNINHLCTAKRVIPLKHRIANNQWNNSKILQRYKRKLSKGCCLKVSRSSQITKIRCWWSVSTTPKTET